MVSRTKALVSLSVSSLVTIFQYFFFTSLPELTYLSPLLILYCIGDLKNSTDMVIHHLATIALNITFGYVIWNHHHLSITDQEAVKCIVCSFFTVEVSTIILSLMHLGYRHFLVKLSFFASFAYYRIYQLTLTLWYNYQHQQIIHICQNSGICFLSWYCGCATLIAMNYYWFYLVLGKMGRALRTRSTVHLKTQ